MQDGHADQPIRRAVQYLRVSTEHQRYSLGNQEAVIAAYAVDHGFEVVRTYADCGKSGLTLKGRGGLKSLLADTLALDRDFDVILVLDVSRWGRFQDPDQAAHYEFVCRSAGVPVRYCGEQFEDDGMMISSIMKHLKRVMAGEYSREMSERIKFAKKRQVLLGFKQGSATRYGLSRVVVGSDGCEKFALQQGQVKALKSDKVVLRAGDASEVATIKRMFHLCAKKGLTCRQIADLLEAEGRPYHNGLPWRAAKVRRLLRNPIYTGMYVYGKTESDLRGGATTLTPDHWLQVEILEPLIGKSEFRAAAVRLSRKTRTIGDEEMLSKLSRVLASEGSLSRDRINANRDLPSASTYAERFGSLLNAYGKIGHHPQEHAQVKPRGANFTDEQMLDELRAIFTEYGYISISLIYARPTCPGQGTIALRFGSLLRAYARVGYVADRRQICLAAAHRRNKGIYWTKGPKPIGLAPKRIDQIQNESALTDQFLLDRLRHIFREAGRVTTSLINLDPDTPPMNAYRRRFGTLKNAYAAAGL